MKRSYLLYLPFMCFTFIFCSCDSSKVGEKSTLNIVENDDFFISITNVSANNAEMTIMNHSMNELYWGSWFCIEKEQNGEWFELEKIILPDGEEWIWEEELYSLSGNNQTNITVCWEKYYGDLSAGNYRIVKSFFFNEIKQDENFYLACEFTIK